jgi:RNA polymerase sigma-70 factor (ECF subfamily)
VDDLALARALATGDEAAFHTLVDQESAVVLRLCYRILGRVDEAEDAAQETFVLAYRALSTYRADGPPGAWLARIATRVCWRRSGTLARRRAATTPLDDVLTATLVGPGDPAAEVIAAEEAAAVRRAAALLPEPYREIVALRFFADLTTADIAAATGRPEATVRTQLRRGLERLRTQMSRAQS